MRHRGVSYKLFLQTLFVCGFFVWAVTFYAMPDRRDPLGEDSGDEESRWAFSAGGLSLLGLSSSRGTGNADDVAELTLRLEQMMTKQQDLQGQLDILRQQIPLPEDNLGQEKPPDISYTKWGKNYYNTRRDKSSTSDQASPKIQASKPQCVLPQPLDFQKNFWQTKFRGCCRTPGSCEAPYEIKDDLLISKCSEPATVNRGTITKTLNKGDSIVLSSVPELKEAQYVKMKCKNHEHLVPVPMTDEVAHRTLLSQQSLQGAAPKPNVVVMMIDAVSRAQFIRALPNTTNLLRKLDRSGRFSVFDFQFFGTLGAYSPPNRYAFFSGYPLPDDQAFFEGSPFPSEEKVLRVDSKQEVWMWDIAKDQGYITYSARDMCSRTAEFVYDDFASRPWTHVHFQDIYCENGYRLHSSATEHCLKDRYAHSYVLESGLQFFDKHSKVPRFAYLDFAEGHEPSMTILRTMEEDLVRYLPRFLSDDNTIVIVASDHGIGYGLQHLTQAGPLEERLPALFMIMPSKILSEEQQQNLRSNQQKIVTGVDVFETVMDIVGKAGNRPWAYSLQKPLPSRNCKEAGINIHACPCQLWDGQVASRIAW